MSRLDSAQFRLVIRQWLVRWGLYSKSAENLLLLTCAQESDFGAFDHQIAGPALGVFQIEPKTFEWIKGKFRDRFPELISAKFEDLRANNRLGCLVARLIYLCDPAPLPDADDVPGLAAYYKRVYNTPKGKATAGGAAAKYYAYVAATDQAV